MDKKSALSSIQTNRRLQTQEEIEAFEAALEHIIRSGDPSVIAELCLAFDDDTEQHDVMFGLVHGIEHLYKENREAGLSSLAAAVPDCLDRAGEWMDLLHYRILNNENVRRTYGRVVSGLDDKTKETIRYVLTAIKTEDPDLFGHSADEVVRIMQQPL